MKGICKLQGRLRMDRKKFQNFLTLVTAFKPDGVLRVKDGIGTISHVDTGNVGFVNVKTEIPLKDGDYGLDFEKLSRIVSAYETSEIEIKTSNVTFMLHSGEFKNRINLLNPTVMSKVLEVPARELDCQIEIELDELLKVVNVIEKVESVEKNTQLAVAFEYDGISFKFMTAHDLDESTEKTFEYMSVLKGKGSKFRSIFPFDYIRDAVKALGKVKIGKIVVHMGQNMPCKLVGENVIYLVANRMEGAT